MIDVRMLDGAPLACREYGGDGQATVIVLHGGPAAAGYMAPVAEALAGHYRVLEPFQRGSDGKTPLTVERHVLDLQQLITEQVDDCRPAIVGHSWGAMLALAFAAAYPGSCGPIVLVGCGTFDVAARQRLKQVLAERFTDEIRQQLAELERTVSDPDLRLAAMGRAIGPAYGHDIVPERDAPTVCDAQAHKETWQDMLRLQAQGVYPAAFAATRSPVLMIHGATDPHPGQMIAEGLRPYLPQLVYHELPMCGHSPWLERAAATDFFAVMHRWLAQADWPERR